MQTAAKKSKRTADSLGFIIFRSLAAGKQKLVDKILSVEEIIVKPTDPDAPANQTTFVESIISIVAKDSPANAIKTMAVSKKPAGNTVRKNGKPLDRFIERITLPA